VSGTTHRHGVRLFLSLLIAFGTLVHLGHPMPAEAHAGVAQITQIVSADRGADPCEQNYGVGAAHCNVTSACALGTPAGTDAAVFGKTSIHRPMMAEALVFGQVIDPQFRPPRLPLQA
jgi:hypothetical protein